MRHHTRARLFSDPTRFLVAPIQERRRQGCHSVRWEAGTLHNAPATMAPSPEKPNLQASSSPRSTLVTRDRAVSTFIDATSEKTQESAEEELACQLVPTGSLVITSQPI